LHKNSESFFLHMKKNQKNLQNSCASFILCQSCRSCYFILSANLCTYSTSAMRILQNRVPFKMRAITGTPTTYTICTERCQIPCTFGFLAKLAPSVGRTVRARPGLVARLTSTAAGTILIFLAKLVPSVGRRL